MDSVNMTRVVNVKFHDTCMWELLGLGMVSSISISTLVNEWNLVALHNACSKIGRPVIRGKAFTVKPITYYYSVYLLVLFVPCGNSGVAQQVTSINRLALVTVNGTIAALSTPPHTNRQQK